jgi:hypothetical protein
MMPMTRDGWSWKPSAFSLATIVRMSSSTTTMNSTLLTARVSVTANGSWRGARNQVVDAAGKHDDRDHHQGEGDLFAVHQDLEQLAGCLPPRGRWQGKSFVIK